MSSWGNEEETTEDQHMESPEGYHLKVTNADENGPALYAKNDNAGANALALEVVGKAYLSSLTRIGDHLTCEAECHVLETLFAEAEVNVVGHLNCEDAVSIDGQLAVGPNNAAGEIDSGGNPQDLKIGTRNVTSDVEIGRDGREVNVKGRLDAEENIRVGTAANDGEIDAADDARDLKIGTDSDRTKNVIIGRDDQSVIVRSDMLMVGQANETGKIESGGTVAAPQDLKIGANGETDDVILGRAGQTIDMFGQERLNGNAVIMNNANAITDANGCGLLFNPDGHPGPAMRCIDFYINGAVVGFVDANGWNNA